MKGNHWSRGGLALVLVGSLAAPGLAQETDRPAGPKPTPPVMEELDRLAGPEGKPNVGPGSGEDSGRHFDAKKRERLMQALQLDEATRNRLSQRLEQLDQKGEELRRQRREALRALRDQAQGSRKDARRGPRNGERQGPEGTPPATKGSAPDSGALKQALERVYAVEDAMSGLRRERLQAARELLTPEQQLKFLIFNVRFQREMRERLQREQGGQEGGPMDTKRRLEGGGEGEKR